MYASERGPAAALEPAALERGALWASCARLATLAMLALAVFALLGPPAASAAPSQESLFQDDDLLLYNSATGTDKALDTLAALGVQRIRVSVFWRLVAPNPGQTARPANFHASDPAAYPANAWDRYDRVIVAARARGIGVDLDITGPAPLWADGTPPDRPDIAATYEPQPQEFGAFVEAVARRYSGSFVPTPASSSPGRSATTEQPPPSGLGGLIGQLFGPNPNGSGSNPAPPPPPGTPPAVPPGQPLPRVDYWSIWNEPNQGGWLTPQWTPNGVIASASIYRNLLDSAWSSLAATGHGSDTILIGETAPKGLNVKGETRAIKPLTFIRALYCVDSHLHRLRGGRAAAVQCPTTTAAAAAFPAAHPALFQATGWAHHPYELTFKPTWVPPDPNYATIGTLRRLTSTLAGIRRAYHQRVELPIYLTEFGYQSNPPSPLGVPLSRQAAYINEAEFLAYQNPHVRAFDQFLLADSPLAVAGSRLASIGGTFQTGLEFLGGKAKPSLGAYRIPIYLPHATIRRGRSLRVWGMVRSDPGGVPQQVTIQYRRGRHGRWRTLAVRATRPRPAYVDTHVRIRASGQLRLAWRDPHGGAIYYSRIVSATVR